MLKVNVNGLNFMVPRVEQGQLAERAYAQIDAGLVLRRTIDRSCGETVWAMASVEAGVDPGGASVPRPDEGQDWLEVEAIDRGYPS